MSILLFRRKSLASRQLAVIRNLWPDAAPGLWYEPGLNGTVYQDSAGKTPGAAGLPAGLILDKSKGGRRDFGEFSTVQTSGDGVVTRVGNTIKITGATTTTRVDLSGYAVALGDRLDISVDSQTTSAVSPVLWISSGGGYSVPNGAGDFGNVLSGTAFLRVQVNSGSAVFNILSVGVSPGNHGSQSTSTARPVYAASPDRLIYDGVDDATVTAFPAALGSNCTVARAIPGVGAQILTGQTVGTTLTQTTTHAGMIIVARPLTASETAAVTGYLNRRAGV